MTSNIPDTDDFATFSREVRHLAMNRFNYTYPIGNLNPYNMAFYEAIMVYAHALKKTIDGGGNKRNGTHILSNLWGRYTFAGKSLHS